MNNIPKGYKQTEVGVIPEDWEVKPISGLALIFVGRDLKTENFSISQDYNFRFPVYSNTVVNNGLYGYYNISEYNGDSLTIVGRGVGLGTAFYRSGEYGAIGRLIVLFPNVFTSAKYLAYYINNFVKIFSESSGIPQLTGISIAKYRILLPPTLEEQTAISNALSDMDELIKSMEKLIAKKSAIKYGAMQELLKPKENWVVKKLGEALKVIHGRSQREVIDDNGNYPVLASGGVIGMANKYLYDKPSVLIGRKGTIDVPQYMDKPFWTIDTLFYTEILELNNAKYLYYQFKLINWYLHNEASGVPSLNARTIENIEISIPGPIEQVRIATILSDMDAEIAALEAKLDKYKQIKQGMMQNLLTGRIRLV